MATQRYFLGDKVNGTRSSPPTSVALWGSNRSRELWGMHADVAALFLFTSVAGSAKRNPSVALSRHQARFLLSTLCEVQNCNSSQRVPIPLWPGLASSLLSLGNCQHAM
jgi:hypothetical protein